APGSHFVGWSGDCTSAGAGACTLNMDASKTITATFTKLSTGQQIFNDVLPGDTYFEHINKMQELGITSGISVNPPKFGQWDTLTRGQMAAFIVRARNLAYPSETQGLHGGSPDNFDYPTNQYFSDVPPGHPFFKHVQKLKELGITSGCEV